MKLKVVVYGAIWLAVWICSLSSEVYKAFGRIAHKLARHPLADSADPSIELARKWLVDRPHSAVVLDTLGKRGGYMKALYVRNSNGRINSADVRKMGYKGVILGIGESTFSRDSFGVLSQLMTKP